VATYADVANVGVDWPEETDPDVNPIGVKRSTCRAERSRSSYLTSF
jgi:hypothetical protein